MPLFVQITVLNWNIRFDAKFEVNEPLHKSNRMIIFFVLEVKAEIKEKIRRNKMNFKPPVRLLLTV